MTSAPRHIAFRPTDGDLLVASVQQFLSIHALRLQDGRVEEMAGDYSSPLIVSIPNAEGGFLVLPSRNRVERALRLKHEGLLELGAPLIHARVLQVRVTSQNRFIALAEWRYLSKQGCRIGQTRTRHFLELNNGAFSVQMVEFERIAFAPVAAWLADVTRAAAGPARLLH